MNYFLSLSTTLLYIYIYIYLTVIYNNRVSVIVRYETFFRDSWVGEYGFGGVYGGFEVGLGWVALGLGIRE